MLTFKSKASFWQELWKFLLLSSLMMELFNSSAAHPEEKSGAYAYQRFSYARVSLFTVGSERLHLYGSFNV